MSGKNSIVVGIDGSKSADLALVWAASTAASRGFGLTVVTAVDIPHHLGDEQVDEFRAVARSRLAAAEALARETAHGASPTTDGTSPTTAGITITAEAHDGKVTDVLLALSEKVSMVVVGASGLGESDSGLLGSTSIGLTAHASSPVAVVRGRSIDGVPPVLGPVVVGVDGSEINQAAVAVAFDEASHRGAPLTAVHVWSDVSLAHISGVPSEWEDIAAAEEAVLAESLAGWQERYPEVDVRRVVAQDRPVRVLGQLSEQASLIVVGTRGRGGFRGMLLGSTSYALINTADCPVLVVR
ncbi:universal stress protein [Rhodococcus sp. G-MC3]|uniref:universal stress protein n=1 Tax=Rhodococcus sp. G-MC3 TaxID=3046209 RepID=UPI0024BB0BA8|nr:universal stress protein [Rhodococcus sp. G-MC3]MDJ0393901.1 universal stress protein [Rhodococcus sp. G-MC3]